MAILSAEVERQLSALLGAVKDDDVGAERKRKRESSPKRAKKKSCKEKFDEFDSLATIASPAQMKLINNAWAPATRKKYGSYLNHFDKFCEKKGIPAHLRYPTSHATLLDYLTDMKGEVGSKAAGDRVTALKNIHAKAGMPWEGDTRQIQLLKKAVVNTAPDGTVEKRMGVTHARMKMLEAGLNFASRKDIAVSFAAKVTRTAMVRLGEFLPSSRKLKKLEERKLPRGKDVQEPFSDLGSRMLNLPTGKTSGERGVKIPICKQEQRELDSIAIWKLHERVNEIDKDTTLCSYLDEKGNRRLLTRSDFMKRCNDVWKENGLGPLTGHSFRIGGATHYLVNGVETNVVKAMGRWKSDAFEEYWRDLEVLAEIHIEMMPMRNKIRSLK
ncbi:hypothetical protein CYLTODRAFT_384779 [Cylindrobasidium torrendii FP15055 ss-10]|uniref:Core-binding (CB) domain-containing protein n=1 Tax=Cylindrobasidium torrendii FP15055 ss-10 TaxID=1314674 RepID=A0A0D7ATN3_9AGAR|nr:hypothetical protein CYLTODRAFT_384779 [Cylindrobasidium torrendii FP15055 ss-10]